MVHVAEDFAAYIAKMVENGGPLEEEYPALTTWIDKFDAACHSGEADDSDRASVLAAFGDAISLDTIQGWVVQQPHGYPGDFEVIERIYAHWASPKSNLVRWDQYFHAQAAPRAVRNRKAYFHTLLDALPEGSQVLNLGSGPGRCMREWFDGHPGRNIHFDCVDMDRDAIEYAINLNRPHLDKIHFIQRNVLRFSPERKYRLAWAGGLFDYFDDHFFLSVARRAINAVISQGQLVIGNFGVGNPSRAYMELGGWRLRHRSPDELISLMMQCGLDPANVRVESEPEGVNLFVHAQVF